MEIINQQNQNQLAEPIHVPQRAPVVYHMQTKRVLKSGVVHYYNATKTYTPRGEPRAPRVVVTDEMREQVLADHRAGVKMKIICERRGITYHVLKKILAEAPAAPNPAA